MKKLNFLVDASFNLLRASEKSEANLRKAITRIDHNSQSLNNAVVNIDKTVNETLKNSSGEVADSISEKILSSLEDAKAKANIAAKRYEQAARFSVLKLGIMFFIFFLISFGLLMFFSIQEIPTIQEIQERRSVKTYLESEVSKLKQYGDIALCNGLPCTQVDLSQKFKGDDGKIYYRIIPKE